MRRADAKQARRRSAPHCCVVSLNPAIDVEWRVDDLRWEEKNLVLEQRRWAGGKGANVARWLQFLGASCELLIPLGGANGRELADHLHRDEISSYVISVADETRANVVITGPAGRQMRFNQPGTRLSLSQWKAILRHVRMLAEQGAHLVLSGSLAPGLPSGSYAELLRAVRGHKVRTFLDCDGRTLEQAIPEHPFLIKPNRFELSQWAGRALRSLSAVREAALKMSRASRGWILVSLGAEGAMLVNATEQFSEHRSARATNVINTLGAGDAVLAGACRGVLTSDDPSEWLRSGLSCGTAATQCIPGALPRLSEFRRLQSKIR